MTAITDEDDAVVAVAWRVLQGEASQGTKNLRKVSEDDGEFVYRIEPGADPETSVDPESVRSDGEFPEADPVTWWASREMVEREVERRGIGDAGPPVADAEDQAQ